MNSSFRQFAPSTWVTDWSTGRRRRALLPASAPGSEFETFARAFDLASLLDGTGRYRRKRGSHPGPLDDGDKRYSSIDCGATGSNYDLPRCHGMPPSWSFHVTLPAGKRSVSGLGAAVGFRWRIRHTAGSDAMALVRRGIQPFAEEGVHPQAADQVSTADTCRSRPASAGLTWQLRLGCIAGTGARRPMDRARWRRHRTIA